jgi:hypothetical protein
VTPGEKGRFWRKSEHDFHQAMQAQEEATDTVDGPVIRNKKKVCRDVP